MTHNIGWMVGGGDVARRCAGAVKSAFPDVHWIQSPTIYAGVMNGESGHVGWYCVTEEPLDEAVLQQIRRDHERIEREECLRR